MITINGKKITSIRFEHKGLRTCFHNIVDPSYLHSEILDPGTVYIDFQDLRDVENLIYMLNRFKEDNFYGGVGEWRETIDFSKG
ncbi:MAG: hypothetical protein Q4E51_08625 [Lachnospiraceae bacterium]|nr:hypothetical protein [Lachnospiraceae bacterium]